LLQKKVIELFSGKDQTTMKKIAIAVVIIVLAVIVCVQYSRLQSLSPPEAYEYTFRDDIDLDYHNPVIVREYFDTGYTVGSFAREMWHNRRLNVRMPNSDNAADRVAVTRYNHLRAYSDSLGARLSRSMSLKKEGFNNIDIAAMEGSSLSPREYRIQQVFGKGTLVRGDKTDGVWELQARLIAKGYVIPHDGYYWSETEIAVKDFQSKNGLSPTGVAYRETLRLLTTN
jgi:murein L,D-transpeptidase YcbB/YkuD